MMAKRNDGIGDLVRGALAGVVATWAMARVAELLNDPGDASPSSSLISEEIEDATLSAQLEGQPEWLLRLDRFMLGSAPPSPLPWTVGAGAGVMYGALRGRLPGAAAASGMVYGSGLYLAADRAPQKSARGAIPWLVYGATAELTSRALERVSK
jgi:hypothetical protein